MYVIKSMSVASEARTLELLKIDYTNRLNTEYQLIPRKHMITLLQRFKHLPCASWLVSYSNASA